MSFKDSRGFTDTQDNQKDFGEKYIDNNSGPFLGTVKYTVDPQKMGRLGVNIPALTLTKNPKAEQITWCQYLSPFYGVKSLGSVNGTDPYSYKASQTSYGMWAIPPDIDTSVLVIFAKGDGGNPTAFWIGCVQEPFMNQQVPGHGSTTRTAMPALGGDFSQSKQEVYGTDLLPAGEKNRKFVDTPVLFEQQKFPINERLADQLTKQGLIKDPVRGTTTSSARRESPSAVFGISTPGRISGDSAQPRIGLEGAPVRVDRESGHSFVMDDGAANGTNQLTRLRTASGHQLLMHDTEGVVYIANGSGNAYIEMDRNGRIDLYSGVGGINMRTDGDFNLHSNSNINIHAGQSIRMSAPGTDEILYTADDEEVRKGTKKEGDVRVPRVEGQLIQSSDYHQTLGEKGVFVSSHKGSIRDYARDGLSSFTEGTQLHGAGGQIHLAGAQVHFNSTGASSLWGPKWMTREETGMEPRLEGDVELAQKGIKPLEPFTRQTKTTVHRFVTHEPMFRASGISGDDVIPIDADDKKQWSKNANTPGTKEFINNKNRLSANSAVRDAQYQADALQYVKQKMGDSTNVVKAKKLLTDFGVKYNDIYGISEKINLPFSIKDSISEKVKGFSVNSTVENVTNSLTSQVIESFTGKSTQLFKDNVFVNSAGELFSLGNTVSGNVDIANQALNTLDGLTKNLSTKNITATIGSISSITQNYQSVVGGQVVGINQVKSLASKAGLFNARDAGRLGQSFLQNVGTNIASNIGTIAGKVSTFFSSSGFFSDARLKEDIRFVGRSPAGVNVYSFKYKQLPGRYMGVMAQEVPWARHMTDTGYYAVDYSKVDVEFRRLH